MNQAQILSFTEAFPPAHKLTEIVLNIQYRKHFNQFIDGVENVLIFLAAVYTVLRQKWVEHNVTERLQLAALNVKEFTLNVAVPSVHKAVTVTYNAGAQVRYVYELISSPLFITL